MKKKRIKHNKHVVEQQQQLKQQHDNEKQQKEPKQKQQQEQYGKATGRALRDTWEEQKRSVKTREEKMNN